MKDRERERQKVMRMEKNGDEEISMTFRCFWQEMSDRKDFNV